MNKKLQYKNKYYVYLHINPKTSQAVYVGKGTGGRAWLKINRSKQHLQWFKNLEKENMKPIIKIESVFDDEKSALKREKEVIKLLLEKEIILFNRNKGGGGHPGGPSHPKSGKPTSKDTKEKLSTALLGKPRPDVSEFNKIRMVGNSFRKGKESSKETKLAISKSLEGNQRRSVKILCENNGKIYNSIKEAWLELNLDERSIFRVLKGEYRHTKGYRFTYI